MPEKAIRRSIRLIALALLAHIALSWLLWCPGLERSFPLLPLLEWQFPSSTLLDLIQVFSLILLLGFIFVFPKKKVGVLVLLVALLWLVIQDLNRLQPWLYFYFLTFGLIVINFNRPRISVSHLRWLLAAVYAWGGFNKLTPFFAEDNFPWFCEAFIWTKPLGQFPAVGYLVALVEFLFAPALLWPRTRSISRYLVVGFHLFIVLAISPFGLNWNSIVIPWNVAMAGMVWLLFDPRLDLLPEASEAKKQPKIAVLAAGSILALAWIFPVLNICHCWDENLSWKMYSNTQIEASFFAEQPLSCPAVKSIWGRFSYDNKRKLLLDDWALAELHVPAYNSQRTHTQLARYLCACADAPESAGLLQLTVNRWKRKSENWKKTPCDLLHK